MSHTCDTDEWGQCPCSSNYGNPPQTTGELANYRSHLAYERYVRRYIEVEAMLNRLRSLIA